MRLPILTILSWAIFTSGNSIVQAMSQSQDSYQLLLSPEQNTSDVAADQIDASVYQFLTAIEQVIASNLEEKSDSILIASSLSNFSSSRSSAFNSLNGHWARSFLEPLVLQGIIPPINSAEIQPDQLMTQAQFSAIIQNAFGVNILNPEQDPEQPISRLQALVTLVNVLNLRSNQIAPERLSRYFIDAHNIPQSNLPQIAAATENRLVVNYPNVRVLNPNKNATLAEVSAFVYQALVRSGDLPSLVQTVATTSNNRSRTVPPPPPPQQTPRATIRAIEVAENADYTLGGGDRFQVFVANFPEHNGEYAVLANGLINMPLLGKISVAGLTVKKLEKSLEDRFSQTMINPNVTVTLLSARPLNIAIAGEVNRPGAYTMDLQVNPTQFPKITQAIQLAGGITQSANLREVKVQRSLKSGRGQVIAVNLWDLFQTGDLRQDLSLRDGDKIIIPTLTRADLTEASQLVNNNLYPTDPQPVKVVIVGEVFQPGSYTLQSGGGGAVLTVTQAIQQAGGITSTADLRDVQVRRPIGNGNENIINVDLFALLQGGDLRQDVILKNGDTVIIPTLTNIDLAETRQLVNNNLYSTASKPMNVAIVGEVTRPGPYTLTAESSSGGILTVTQAIQQAGGITASADLRQIQVKRINRNGTEEVIDVDLFALLQEGDLQQDAILKTGDTVIIPTATQLTPSEVSELARSTLSPTTIRVNLVGELQRPGVIEVPPNTPLSQAILAAGGFNNRAHEGSVELVRLSPDGTLEKREIQVDFSEGIAEENNPTLRSNDIIVVRPTGLNRISDDLSSILSATSPFGLIFQFIQRLF